MNGVNPIAGSIYQASTVQRTLAGERDAGIRRTQLARKNVGTTGDTLEHSVESSDVISPLHDEEREQNSRKRKRRAQPELPVDESDDDLPRLDLTA